MNKDNELVQQIFSFTEDFKQATITIQTETPMDFEFFKAAIYDFIQDCDTNGKDLFNGDDCRTLLN